MPDQYHHEGSPSPPSWCPIPDVADVIRTTGDHVIRMSERQIAMQAVQTRMEQHQVEQNGSIRHLNAEALRAEGAMQMLKWLIGILLGLMSVGVAFAGLMLARGG